MNRIKMLREEFGMTQQELANKLNGAKSTIAMYEKEDRKPSIEVLLNLSEIFNCSIDYLLGKSDIRKLEKMDKKSINDYYEQKINILLKNKYIDEFLKLNLSNFEIDSLIKVITSDDDKLISENYHSLLNGVLSILSLNHNEEIVEKTKKLIKNYNQEKMNILNDQINIYRKKIQEQENDMKKEHLDKLHPFISGKKSAKLDENVEALLHYMDMHNIDDVSLVPVLGKITAGQPILAEEHLEGYLPVDLNIYGMTTSDDLFFLRVSGQSMNLKVKNGDYALIRKQDYAENGDIIVAILNGDDEATLKRYKRLNEQFVLLEPMSTDTSIEPITIDLKSCNFKIIGKAVGQFGKF